MANKIKFCLILLVVALCFAQAGYAGTDPLPCSMKSSHSKDITRAGKQEIININTADAKELEKLPGVGRVIAKRIVEYRRENGYFNDKKDIMNVRGIGEKKYKLIKDLIEF